MEKDALVSLSPSKGGHGVWYQEMRFFTRHTANYIRRPHAVSIAVYVSENCLCVRGCLVEQIIFLIQIKTISLWFSILYSVHAVHMLLIVFVRVSYMLATLLIWLLRRSNETWIKIIEFSANNCLWKCYLRNIIHFVEASMFPITITGIIFIYISAGPWCFDYPRTQYSGRVNVTVGGVPCRRWDGLPDHFIEMYGERWDFPDINIHVAENYCRNPDRDIWPWCFTKDPDIPFDFCSVEDLVCHPDDDIFTDTVEINTSPHWITESHTLSSKNESPSSWVIFRTPLTIVWCGLYLYVTM